MWRARHKKEKKLKIYNNRLYIIAAIIFLLALSLIVQLYKIQIGNHDYYIALASGQHNLQTHLEPERGRIFISEIGSEELFPLATNKDFASVFFIPKEAVNREELAEKVYFALEHENVLEKVDEYFKDLDQDELTSELAYVASLNLTIEEILQKQAEVRRRYQTRNLDKDFGELREMKIGLEVDKLKQEFLDNYLRKLNKANDPYEPLVDKVDEEKLINLFRHLIGEIYRPLPAEALEVNNFKVYLKDMSLPVASDVEISETGKVTYPGLSYQLKKFRYYPEESVGSHLVGFVSNLEGESHGHYGLEEFFDEELFGKAGLLKAGRGSGQTIILNDREYIKAQNGADIILTIDRSMQFIVCDKLKKYIEDYEADSGDVIIVEPKTGAILAMCTYPNFDPNNYQDVDDLKLFNNAAVSYQYEPGSIFKTITMAIALDQNKVTPHTFYEDRGQIMIKGWPKPISNSDFTSHGPYGWVDMDTVLAESLNTGAIFSMQEIGANIFSEYVEKFGFGEKTGIELTSESTGDIDNLLKKRIKEIDAATASFGQGLAVTPLQMIMSYAAIANEGVLMKPYLVKEIRYPDGTRQITQPRVIRKVISQKSASLISGMLVNVIESGHAKKAGVNGYYIGGKTGTAQVASSKGGYSEEDYAHSFVGIAPIDNPKFVALVKLDSPKTVRFSADSAAPLFGEIADFLLKYYQVSKER